jgi:hypothetical protein
MSATRISVAAIDDDGFNSTLPSTTRIGGFVMV